MLRKAKCGHADNKESAPASIMGLLDLRSELICLVAEYLPAEGDLNSFAQTSSLLYAQLNWLLYNHNIQFSNDSALLWAAKIGQKDTVRKLLEERAWVDPSIRRFDEALVWAAAAGHEEIADRLVSKGANFNFETVGSVYANAL
jgi:hypothetical protein